MANTVMQASKRERGSKGALNALRNEGNVPGVLYGHHREAQSISMAKTEVEKFMKGHGIGSRLDIEVNGAKSMVIIKDIQREILRGSVMHLDFQELTLGEKVKVKLPIHFVNKDVLDGRSSVFQEILHELEVQTLPKYLVDSLDIDVSGMKIGDILKVEDLPIFKDENYELLADADAIVATLAIAKAKVEEVEEAPVAAFEVPVVGEEATEE